MKSPDTAKGLRLILLGRWNRIRWLPPQLYATEMLNFRLITMTGSPPRTALWGDGRFCSCQNAALDLLTSCQQISVREIAPRVSGCAGCERRGLVNDTFTNLDRRRESPGPEI
jgi:hypothetical protein